MFKKLLSFFKGCWACSPYQQAAHEKMAAKPVNDTVQSLPVEKKAAIKKPIVKKAEGKKKVTAKQKIAKSKAAKRTPKNKN